MVVLCSLFAMALWKPIFGVLGYIAVYAIYNPDIWWGAAVAEYLPRPSFTAVLFLAAGCLLHIRSLNWAFTLKELCFYAFLAVSWIITIRLGNGSDISYIYLEKLLKLFIFIFLFIRTVNKLQYFQWVVLTLILAGVFLSIQGHLVSRDFFFEGRLEELGGLDFKEGNSLAAFLTLSLIFLSIKMIDCSWFKRLLFIPGVALILDTIILTQSRAVFMGLAFAFPYVVFRAPRQRRLLIVTFALLGAVLFLKLANTTFFQRMQTITEAETRYKENRLEIWETSLHVFADHPFGVGVKNFEQVLPSYGLDTWDAHSTYVLCYSEIGIVGFLLFLLIIIETFRQLIKTGRVLDDSYPGKNLIDYYIYALVTILIVYTLGCMTTHAYLYTEFMWLVLTLPLSLQVVVKDISRSMLKGFVLDEIKEYNTLQSAEY